MLVDRNNTIFLLWEVTSFLCKLCEQILFCFVHQHRSNANHLLDILWVQLWIIENDVWKIISKLHEADVRRRTQFERIFQISRIV